MHTSTWREDHRLRVRGRKTSRDEGVACGVAVSIIRGVFILASSVRYLMWRGSKPVFFNRPHLCDLDFAGSKDRKARLCRSERESIVHGVRFFPPSYRSYLDVRPPPPSPLPKAKTHTHTRHRRNRRDTLDTEADTHATSTFCDMRRSARDCESRGCHDSSGVGPQCCHRRLSTGERSH